MKKINLLNNGIPVSPSLNSALAAEHFKPRKEVNKRRLLVISGIALLNAVAVSAIAKFLVVLIDVFTNVSFYGQLSLSHASPSANTLGWWVVLIPAVGGVIVGLMAWYGSSAIRGHGIPEAMEQILTNQSKIKPAITYLKPISSAIAIGTGGPFGAEGPIIATGGALGSTIGQLLKISHQERKVLLAAGATAGMSAIFGSPIAAVFLAIELLLFEFSPRSLIPVAIACIVGAAGHHFLFGQGPVFVMGNLNAPSNSALLMYCVLGLLTGLLSVGVSKAVYGVEELFEKLPVHWMWWPAIGGLMVGIVGYFAPETLGVGYENITSVLSGNLPLQVIVSLCFLKFLSWVVALGSGTSGGTLAPLLTIGGASGALLGMGAQYLFPEAGITLPLAALVGMAAMFAGASRALLTSIVFAMETTAQSHALLPLLGSCVASYFVSFFLMEHTIMTEKIARRGVKTPQSYEPDLLERTTVQQVISQAEIVLHEEDSIGQVREWLQTDNPKRSNYFVVANKAGEYKGLVSAAVLFSLELVQEHPVGSLVRHHEAWARPGDSLRMAAEKMAREDVDVLPVVKGQQLAGLVSYHDILSVYKTETDNHELKRSHISLKRNGFKILLRGQKFVSVIKRRDK